MKYAVEVGTGAKFHKYLFRHSKVDTGGVHKQESDLINLLLFFKNKKFSYNTSK
jgi:hypothetical protein